MLLKNLSWPNFERMIEFGNKNVSVNILKKRGRNY